MAMQQVLTNSTYKELLSGYKNGSIYNDNSIERFSAACNMINQFKKDKSATSLINQSFAILNKTSQGDYTKWSIVYDITEKKIWFKTERSKQLRSINFSSFNFSCAVSSKQIDMNGKEEGEISRLFSDFSDEMNRLTVEKAIEESSSRVAFNSEQKRAILGYPGTINCK
jgi:penicillin V acylase-like amidase (Ntn superfamily)